MVHNPAKSPYDLVPEFLEALTFFVFSIQKLIFGGFSVRYLKTLNPVYLFVNLILEGMYLGHSQKNHQKTVNFQQIILYIITLLYSEYQ